jgi:hypothetical protein
MDSARRRSEKNNSSGERGKEEEICGDWRGEEREGENRAREEGREGKLWGGRGISDRGRKRRRMRRAADRRFYTFFSLWARARKGASGRTRQESSPWSLPVTPSVPMPPSGLRAGTLSETLRIPGRYLSPKQPGGSFLVLLPFGSFLLRSPSLPSCFAHDASPLRQTSPRSSHQKRSKPRDCSNRLQPSLILINDRTAWIAHGCGGCARWVDCAARLASIPALTHRCRSGRNVSPTLQSTPATPADPCPSRPDTSGAVTLHYSVSGSDPPASPLPPQTPQNRPRSAYARSSRNTRPSITCSLAIAEHINAARLLRGGSDPKILEGLPSAYLHSSPNALLLRAGQGRVKGRHATEDRRLNGPCVQLPAPLRDWRHAPPHVEP